MKKYSLKEGEELVRAARNAIELQLKSIESSKEVVRESLKRFNERRGVFVTIMHYPTRELRGCIGTVEPEVELKDAVVEMSISAAFNDSRFVPVSMGELEHMVIEVSLTSELTEIKGSMTARLRSIKVGRDGILVRYGHRSGLLLPQVPVEQGWKKERFLEEACVKAGLHQSHWKQPNIRMYRFEAQVFVEESPEGSVLEISNKMA